MRGHAEKWAWTIAGEYVDPGVSGHIDARPDIMRMIKAGMDGAIEIILIHKLDRFFRNREKSAMYKRLLRQKGVHVLSVTEPTDPDAAVSFMIEGVLEVFADWYSINLSEETKKGKLERVHHGLWNGRLRHRYQKGEKPIPEPSPQEVPVIGRDHKLCATGQYTDR